MERGRGYIAAGDHDRVTVGREPDVLIAREVRVVERHAVCDERDDGVEANQVHDGNQLVEDLHVADAEHAVERTRLAEQGGLAGLDPRRHGGFVQLLDPAVDNQIHADLYGHIIHGLISALIARMTLAGIESPSPEKLPDLGAASCGARAYL